MNFVNLQKNNFAVSDDNTSVTIKNSPDAMELIAKNTSEIINSTFGKIDINDITIGDNGEIVLNGLDPEKVHENLNPTAVSANQGCVNIGSCSGII